MEYKPAIGITCSLWSEKKQWLMQAGKTYDHGKHDYSRLIHSCGGLPLFLPTIEDQDLIADYTGRIDGLLLSGGYDIDPSFFGQQTAHESCIIHPYRDRFEIELAHSARKVGLPILGICRGLQILNIAFGGDIFQDDSLRPGTGRHNTGVEYEPAYHLINLYQDTRLERLAATSQLKVNSTHHQHLDRIAEGFTVSAEAEDGVAEAIERIDGKEYILGVQWHPELMPEDKLSRALFTNFIRASAEYCLRRG